MLRFGNLKTRTKILVSFLALCGLMAGLGGYSIYQLGRVNDSTVEIAANWLPSVKYTSAMNTGTSDFRIREWRHAAATEPAQMDAAEKQMADDLAAFEKNRAAYEPMISSPDERKLYDEFAALWKDYLAEHDKLVALSRQNKNDEARELLLGKSMQLFNDASTKLGELVELNSAGAEQARTAAAASYEAARMWTVGILVAALAVAVAMALVIGGMIAKPLVRTVAVLEAVAEGDFTVRLDVDTKDEVGRMAEALNAAVGAVRSALLNVRMVADGVASASTQLSSAGEEISSGAQEQASSLEETASSLEEITATVKQNADSAEQANQLAAGAKGVAEKGGEVVAAAVAGMGEINEASKRIADIITTIDEIAFQTNLLALNAAVEAARAGEQGRGFAVVAGEVRNLAQRSAGAAKEIKGLIGDSVRKVEAGTQLVNKSGETLAEIVGSVKRVTDIVGEIAAASREQAAGIDQVNTAVTQMDTVTQANASQTEELSSTAEGLSGQARQLQALVAKFRLGTEESAVPASSSPAPAAKAKSSAKAADKPKANGKTVRNGRHDGHASDRASERDLDLVGAVAGGHRGSHFEEF